MSDRNHTVEKIGGTSMSRVNELRDTLLIREGDLYNRVFVVSAFGGITNLLLEHKKTGEQGVYAAFADSETDDHAWMAALKKTGAAMEEAHRAVLDHPADIADANDFVAERMAGARSFLIDLGRLCSYGHFRLTEHMSMVRELLSGLGEAHSAYVTTLMLKRAGVSARFVDLSGWRDEGDCDLNERIEKGLADVDLAAEMPIVTGYAQCKEGLMREFDRGYSEVTFSHLAALTGAREATIEGLLPRSEVRTETDEPAPVEERRSGETLTVHSPVRSGQSIIHLAGDVIVLGPVASGSEIVAGGSIHVYGALRGSAFAGAEGNEKARIFCRRNEAELVAINGWYRTAEDMEPSSRGIPAQAYLDNGALWIAPIK